jgi:predicted dehydrogenase
MSATATLADARPVTTGRRRPRLGFLGVGWIGRSRMDAVARAGAADVAAIADSVIPRALEAAAAYPQAEVATSYARLLEAEVDGVVIATPSALHAEQTLQALERGVAVFCQKPLTRTAAEAEAVVASAHAHDLRLGVDLSYRSTEAMRRVRELVRGGGVGPVYAVDAVFHNAYGPDKGWCFDPRLSGGGCVIDLGTHLIDLARWTLDFPEVEDVRSRLFAKGRRLRHGEAVVEDYAAAELDLAGGTLLRVTCSWGFSAGVDAAIEVAFHGSEGTARFRNVGGSFYDFTAEHLRGARTETLCAPPDAWGGRALIEWAQHLARGEDGFDPESRQLIALARALDGIYGR